MSSKVFDRFVTKAPFAVMTRALTQDFIGSDLQLVFDNNREKQYEYLATFQAVAMTVADVALDFSENFNQAYKEHKENLDVSRQSFYAKTRGIEPAVSESLVSHAAKRTIQMQDAMGFTPWELLPGYRCLSIDGNVLAKSDKRLKDLRDVKGAPLPGKLVARFDLQRQVFDRAYVLLDGHAQESTCCDRIVDDIQPNDVVIADRHYCIVPFLNKLAQSKSFFVIRQHGRLKGVLLGKRKRIGRSSTGVVYEQALKLSAAEDAMVVRRITVILDSPTRDGDEEIHVLTNLPATVSAKDVAEVYRHRWEEETAFNILQMTLTCEKSGVGHPKAATFLFCMSLLAFNLRQTIFAALFATHDESEVEAISHFHVSKNVSDKTEGMLIAITEDEWAELIPTTIKGLVAMLKKIARTIDLKEYRKSVRGPKKKKPHRSRNVASSHVSTAKLLGLT
ncbi:Transposase DDE domain protein [Stieleria neptunia]|uniref:Transposase DDE domain protein n=3 Tax=Stieleria neptunia TaxID=2527979 RepID=A0A518I1W1_9BACT|nr:Transposase DDE domain protein [Stieleria neptunia]QDV47095.1 Transposase DDE domain protein [Stieleria neptunia]